MNRKILIGIIAVVFAAIALAYHFAWADDASVSFTPNPLVFPDTVAGQTSAPLTMTIRNVSGGDLKITQTSLADTTNFSKTSDNCVKNLPPNGTCTMTFTFHPTSAGLTTTTISVVSDEETSVDSAIIRGNGLAPAVTLLPTSINFGDHPTGHASAPSNVTLTNSGSSTLNISSIAASGDFGVTNNCAATLAPLASCTLSITFFPTALGARTGSVTITDDASGSPQTVSLSGNGISPGQAGINLSPNSLSFGNVTVGATSGAMTITVTNTGTVNLNIASVTIAQPSPFAETNNCGAAITPDATCTINITFTPGSAAVFSGTLTITSNAATPTITATLAGRGTTAGSNTPLAELSSTSIDFGEVDPDQPIAPQILTITNGGTGDLVFGTVSVSGEDTGSFSIHDHCEGTTLPPGGSCTTEILFAPVLDGIYTATLVINDNSAGSPQSVLLSGSANEAAEGAEGGCTLIPRR